MPNQNLRGAKRLRNRIVIFALTAILMFASTYAWFIGMRTVNVSSFDVEIASTDSLMLSIDGAHWYSTLSINKENFNDTGGGNYGVYAKNTNTWAGTGLVPMSSVGDMDAGASRMKIFEKASLTPTPGGYRLLASRVDNFNNIDPENPQPEVQDGFVAFDLFIHNFSGHQYIDTLRPADEEAIYLTTDSKVSVGTLSGGVDNTGIENSVRVAFAQIGRVNGTSQDAGLITGINCEPDVDGNPSINGAVTGICRTATIWEPNDTAHVDAAISWYSTSCFTRKDDLGVTAASYNIGTPCGTVTNGTAYPTYAVTNKIDSDDKVDVYDGKEFNGFEGHTALLNPVTTFTDSMKIQTGMSRPQFMTLAPNSITKVRVYIYIEGQDIDNYDFASIGKAISVKFGFTKERYTNEDIKYNGPDFTAPVITLNGASVITLNQGDEYTELEATAEDITFDATNTKVTTDLSEDVVITGVVDTAVKGTYYVRYNVSDAAGNAATEVVRTIIVK